jgi:hypothetical protein
MNPATSHNGVVMMVVIWEISDDMQLFKISENAHGFVKGFMVI